MLPGGSNKQKNFPTARRRDFTPWDVQDVRRVLTAGSGLFRKLNDQPIRLNLDAPDMGVNEFAIVHRGCQSSDRVSATILAAL